MIVLVALVVVFGALALVAAGADRVRWPDPSYDSTDRFAEQLGAIRRTVGGSR